MTDTTITTLDGGQAAIAQSAIANFASNISGGLLTQNSPGYDEARTIWNVMIDKHPAIIAQCKSSTDVAAAVSFAAEYSLLTAVHGCGHNVAGNAVCQGGLMIDLSQMKDITIADDGTVTAGPGCALGDLDEATQEQGLVVPGGIVSTTGIGGLTLGGGFGWLSRKWGMTVDNLLSVEMVLADGSQVTASASENADLFWGICGGGGNFGVVTSFTYKSHKLGPEVYCGLVVKEFSGAREYLKFHFDYVQKMPDEMSIWAVARKAPPLPFLPADVHGKHVMVCAFMYTGDEAEGAKLIQPIRDWGTTVGEHVGMAPFTAWQSGFDGLQEPGMRNYWKSHNFVEMNDEVIDAIVSAIKNQPTDFCEIFLPHLGGASGRVDAMATAYHHRDDAFIMNVHTRWENATDDTKCVNWARKLFTDTKPHATGGVYVNFVSDEGEARVHDCYPEEVWGKLVELKQKFDPHNLFRMNQNIQPGAAQEQVG